MFFIACRFKKTEGTEPILGFAVCSDPNTPVTFIMPNGEPYKGEVWSFTLLHYTPWAKLEHQ